ncbi:conserved hypothetical protein [Desulfamplus magnetovallimortis]|uniref:General secretion pathway protein M n=2 Tax=Desulfamplus magnetovallimortis TaxID=1246637 RepID=A0A1W1HL95_9BACT|nr:conserved hypothetical protein [Desulfamplus magnetovallimortis]
MILTAMSVIAIAIITHFIIFPAIDKKENIIHRITIKQKELYEMESLKLRYNKIRQAEIAEKAIVMKRDASFTLFSFLDQLARTIQVRQNVAYMKPSARKSDISGVTISNVKVKLDNLLIDKVVDLINAIETSENGVHITSLSLAASGNDRKLTAVIETETIVLDER